MIYNVTIDNCGHCDFCKLRHNRKIFCRLGQYWMQAALTVNYCMEKRFRSRDRTHSEFEKLAPNSGENQKRFSPQFDGIFGRKLTFYQQFFRLYVHDASF